MIRSQNKNFQFLGFFIIICDLLLDLPLPSSSSDFRFKQISLSGQIFFGLVFLGRLFGRVTNFEGANLTRRLTLALFFLSLWWWLKKNIISSYSVFSISHAIEIWTLYRHPHPKEKGRFYWRLAFSNSCIKKSRTLIKMFWFRGWVWIWVNRVPVGLNRKSK